MEEKFDEGAARKKASIDYEFKVREIQFQAEHERYNNWYKVSQAAVIQLGQSAAKALLIANGGALAALLTFFGALLGRGYQGSGMSHADVMLLAQALRPSFVALVLGFSLVVFALLAGYISQGSLTASADITPTNHKHGVAKSWAQSTWWIAVTCGFLSFVLFLFGALDAVMVLTGAGSRFQ
ncbi:MAG: hypothetical protein NBV67_00465 [Tagaea sp.]|nr:hypothetical protein [Tagaea sp.]